VRIIYSKATTAYAMRGRSSGVKPQERDVHRVEGILASVHAKVAPEQLAPNGFVPVQSGRTRVESAGIARYSFTRSVRAIFCWGLL
jgi:hypothetical protein